MCLVICQTGCGTYKCLPQILKDYEGRLDGYKEWVGRDTQNQHFCSKMGSIIIQSSVQCKHLGKGLKLQYRKSCLWNKVWKNSTETEKNQRKWERYSFWLNYLWNRGDRGIRIKALLCMLFTGFLFTRPWNAHWLASIKANFYQYIYIIINNKIKASVMWEWEYTKI